MIQKHIFLHPSSVIFKQNKNYTCHHDQTGSFVCLFFVPFKHFFTCITSSYGHSSEGSLSFLHLPSHGIVVSDAGHFQRNSHYPCLRIRLDSVLTRTRTSRLRIKRALYNQQATGNIVCKGTFTMPRILISNVHTII